MASHTLKLAFASGFVFSETALSNVVKQVKATGATVRGLELVNTGNEDVYVKGYFAVPGSVTLGTTAPDFIWMIPALKTRRVLLSVGGVYPTALSIVATTTKGTAGTTAPAVPVSTKVIYT
jgi:hypothetical protein